MRRHEFNPYFSMKEQELLSAVEELMPFPYHLEAYADTTSDLKAIFNNWVNSAHTLLSSSERISLIARMQRAA